MTTLVIEQPVSRIAARPVNATPPANGLVARPADMVFHRDGVERVWSESFRTAPPERFNCYLDHPLEPSRLWTLQTAAGDVVGTTGMHLRELWVAGRPQRIAQPVNLAILPEYRTAGPALQVQRAALADVMPRVMMSWAVTSKAAGVQRRIGYQELGPVQRWTKPLRTAELLTRRLGMSGIVRAAAPVLDVALEWASRESWSRPRGWRVERIERFDSRFDDLAQTAGWCGITTVRTAAYLNWRLFSAENVCPTVTAFVAADGRLAGYAAFRRDGKYVDLLDIMAAVPEAMPGVLAATVAQIRRSEPDAAAVCVGYFGGAWFASLLRQFGFLARPQSKLVLAALNGDRVRFDAPLVLDSENWFATDLDLDL